MYYRIDGKVTDIIQEKFQQKFQENVKENFVQTSNKSYHSPWVLIGAGVLIYLIVIIWAMLKRKQEMIMV